MEFRTRWNDVERRAPRPSVASLRASASSRGGTVRRLEISNRRGPRVASADEGSARMGQRTKLAQLYVICNAYGLSGRP